MHDLLIEAKCRLEFGIEVTDDSAFRKLALETVEKIQDIIEEENRQFARDARAIQTMQRIAECALDIHDGATAVMRRDEEKKTITPQERDRLVREFHRAAFSRGAKEVKS